ncbi:MAG TPA: hypothetical protein VNY05_45080 [Candidatus Acidoferrales bacterium]|nr:hypothetical protein [Candidatus Acidoferrales bacterium]
MIIDHTVNESVSGPIRGAELTAMGAGAAGSGETSLSGMRIGAAKPFGDVVGNVDREFHAFTLRIRRRQPKERDITASACGYSKG